MVILDYLNISNPLLRRANRKLACILVLNLLDGLLTYAAVSKGYATEVNLLMAPVVTDPGRLLLYKLFLPSLLILFVAFIINRYNFAEMKIARAFISLCFFAYLCVIAFHTVWIGKAIRLF